MNHDTAGWARRRQRTTLASILLPGAALSAAAAVGVVAAATAAPAPQRAQLEPSVLTALSTAGDVPVIVALSPSPPDEPAGAAVPFASDDADGGALDIDAARIAAGQARVLSALAPGDFRPTHRYRHIPALAGRITRTGLAALSDHPDVVAIALDRPIEVYLDESVPFIGADKVHRQGIQGTGVRVAVLDTGTDTGGLDLRDAIVAEACFVTPASLCPPAPHVSEDSDGHGTSVAGIVASRGRQAPKGVAPAADIVSIKLIEERNNAAESATLAAFDWILDRDDVDVMNMSFGGGAYEGVCDTADANTRSLSEAVARLRAKGVVPVAASGNDGSQTKMGAPACIAGVVSVGAVQDYETAGGADAKIADFTNRNATLDLLAPGTGIKVAGLGSRLQTNFSGTSAAAPHVAGAVALLRQAAPWAGPDVLEDVLKRTGGRPTLRYGTTTISTIRVDAALRELQKITPTATAAGGTPTPTPSPSPTGTASRPPASATPTATISLTPPAVTPSPRTPSATPVPPTAPTTPTQARATTDTPTPPTTATPVPATTTPPGPGTATAAPTWRVYLPLSRRT